MKTLLLLLSSAWSGLALAAAPADHETIPEGLAASDWAGIRAAHDTARHAVQREEGGGDLIARNPGQQWSAEFDGKGFTITPDEGAWTWGLDLTGYGSRTLSAATSPQLRHEGGKITCQRDENLTEWFINDSRGLEQGWDIKLRPERADPSAPLRLHLTSRGGFRPQVSASGESVSFQPEDGGNALTYRGLKAWDAEGKVLAVRFEQGGEDRIRIAVDDQNARYPITIDPVVQQAYLKASNAGDSDRFGFCVAISDDTVVVGAPYEGSAATGVNGDQTSNAAGEAGAVYVFVRNGSIWTQQAYLKASNTEAGDRFGCSVAISGDTLVVGARWEDSAATGVNGDQSNNLASAAGAAYVFVRSGTTWTQQAYLKASNATDNDNFGCSVAVSGDTLLVGALWESSAATGVNGDQASTAASGSGAAYVFTRGGTTWTQQAYLKASNTQASDYFGISTAISGDTAVVGAEEEDGSLPGVNPNQADNQRSGAGAAYVFTRSGATWTQQAYLKASNPGNDNLFGRSVAIAGDTLIVGARGERSTTTGVNNPPAGYGNVIGAAYIFARNSGLWTQEAYLKPHINTGVGSFGSAVAISGDKVIVAAMNGSLRSAYVFSRSGTTWTQLAYFPGDVSSSTGNYYDFHGCVGIAGDTVVVGAHEASSASTGVTRLEPPRLSSIYQSGSAFITHLDYNGPLPADLAVRLATAPILRGGTAALGPAVTGSSRETSFEIASTGPGTLELSGSPRVSVSGSSEFTVSAQPDPGTLPGPSGSTTFKVLFTPTSGGTKTAALSIPTNDGYNSNFILNLTAPGLSFVNDTDGDGMSDASEYNMPGLNFDWQVKQTALVNTYLTNANGAGLYTPSQVQALRTGTPSIARNQANGRVKLTMDWKKATNLSDFSNFPAPAGSSVAISPSGAIEFEFAVPDNAALFRIDQE
ncbi:choice-of-anchor D domain-containing protein [Haloferula sp. BvORR071]|uniref:choice-of-anchor D domain-containing protein n=1 Tax=Haloferula sp. BvORR071 TaxID=1396141 RepID=UPI000696A115|nr:choice-of-anchor D domain-containing protein [Haloferula sp. BvORR071]